MTMPISSQNIDAMITDAKDGSDDRKNCYESVMDLLAIYEHSRSRAMKKVLKEED